MLSRCICVELLRQITFLCINNLSYEVEAPNINFNTCVIYNFFGELCVNYFNIKNISVKLRCNQTM